MSLSSWNVNNFLQDQQSVLILILSFTGKKFWKVGGFPLLRIAELQLQDQPDLRSRPFKIALSTSPYVRSRGPAFHVEPLFRGNGTEVIHFRLALQQAPFQDGVMHSTLAPFMKQASERPGEAFKMSSPRSCGSVQSNLGPGRPAYIPPC